MVGNDVDMELRDLPVNDPIQRKPDITKARAILGWEPTVSLRTGLEETIAYFRSVVMLNA